MTQVGRSSCPNWATCKLAVLAVAVVQVVGGCPIMLRGGYIGGQKALGARNAAYTPETLHMG